MTVLVGILPGLLIMALLITGGYFAARYVHSEKPFRYSFSPFHALAILVVVGFALLKLMPPNHADEKGQHWMSLLLPFSLMIILVLLAFDWALQFILRDRTKIYWIEAIVIAVILTRTISKFV